MKKLIFTIIGVVLVALVIYAILVRGVGVSTKVESPSTIVQNGERFTYYWEIKKDMPTPRTEVSAAAFGAKIYVIGGMDGFGGVSKAVEIYDPKTDTWVKGLDLPEGRHHAAVVSLGDFLYVIGGYTDLRGTPTDTVYRFSQEEDCEQSTSYGRRASRNNTHCGESSLAYENNFPFW